MELFQRLGFVLVFGQRGAKEQAVLQQYRDHLYGRAEVFVGAGTMFYPPLILTLTQGKAAIKPILLGMYQVDELIGRSGEAHAKAGGAADRFTQIFEGSDQFFVVGSLAQDIVLLAVVLTVCNLSLIKFKILISVTDSLNQVTFINMMLPIFVPTKKH